MEKRNGLFRKLCVAIFIAAVLTCVRVTASTDQIKIAIVDVGTNERIPSSFMSLLEVGLSKYPSMVLLERTEIDKLLKEQALSVFLSGNPEAVRTGKILAVDAFVMLEIVNFDNVPHIRIRVVDTKTGTKFSDFLFQFHNIPGQYIQQSEKLCSIIAENISQAVIPRGSMVTIAIHDCRSETSIENEEKISAGLIMELENQLSVLPGFIVLERAHLEKLSEERNIASVIMENLSSATVALYISFRIDKQDNNHISVHLTLKQAEDTVCESGFEGKLTNLRDLCKEISQTLSEKLSDKHLKPVSQNQEAAMLINVAQAYCNLENIRRAFSPAEAALALVPDSSYYNYCLLQMSQRLFYQGKPSANEAIIYGLKGIRGAERILIDCEKRPYDIDSYCMIGIFLSELSRKMPLLGDLKDTPEEIYSLYDRFWNLYDRFKSFTLGETDKFLFYVGYVSQFIVGYGFGGIGDCAVKYCTDIDMAIKRSQETLDIAIKFKAFHPLPSCAHAFVGGLNTLVNSFYTQGTSNYKIDEIARKKMAEYLEKLCKSDNPVLQTIGEGISIGFSCRVMNAKPEEVYMHVQHLLKVLKNEELYTYIPAGIAFDPLALLFFSLQPCGEIVFSKNRTENLKVYCEIYLDLIQFLHTTKPPKSYMIKKSSALQIFHSTIYDYLNSLNLNVSYEVVHYLLEENFPRGGGTALENFISAYKKKMGYSE